MDDPKPALRDELGLRDRWMLFSAVEATYGSKAAFDIAERSNDLMLKLIAIESRHPEVAHTLRVDLSTLSQKTDGTPESRAGRWLRRLNRRLREAGDEAPTPAISKRFAELVR